MTSSRVEATVDYARLGAFLRVLGVPNRLELLRSLQVPQAVGEIRLAPFRRDLGRNPVRSLSRQAIDVHLGKLENVGLVQPRQARRGGRRVTEYVTNHARLFIVADELRRLSLLPTAPAGLETRETVDAAGPGPRALAKGPQLIVARGALEGHSFPLRGRPPWTIGRGANCDVSLPYDPFVSKRNATIRRDGAAFRLRSVPGARNGTQLNWRLLAADEGPELSPGDVIGVGRSLLVFREV